MVLNLGLQEEESKRDEMSRKLDTLKDIHFELIERRH
jgi:hypothetical protein